MALQNIQKVVSPSLTPLAMRAEPTNSLRVGRKIGGGEGNQPLLTLEEENTEALLVPYIPHSKVYHSPHDICDR